MEYKREKEGVYEEAKQGDYIMCWKPIRNSIDNVPTANETCQMLNNWFNSGIPVRISPLFYEKHLQVTTTTTGRWARKVLVRHAKTDRAIIETVQAGLMDDTWQGFLYVMGYYPEGSSGPFCPLYVGKTGRRGNIHPINTNIKNIERNKSAFARWGHGDYWHIGQVSNSLFRHNEKASDCRHDDWAEALFEKPFEEARLKKTVYLAIISWRDRFNSPTGRSATLKDLETEVIALAKKCNPNLLNKQD